MTQFEYLAKDIQLGGGVTAEQIESELNEFGKDGWEVVSNLQRSNNFMCFVFKREKLEPRKPLAFGKL
jgi:hypothetical protein